MAQGWPGPEGSLRNVVQSGLADVREAVAHLCVVIEKMDRSKPEIKILRLELLGLQESLDELEERLVNLENHKNTVSWLMALLAAMFSGMALTYVIQLLR